MAELQLTTRDHAVLWYTWQNRFLAFRHYQRKFWGDTSIQAVQHRIYKLREAGLLNQAQLPMLDARSLFCTTRKGNQKLLEIGLINEAQATDYPRRPGEFKPAMLHDLQVVDLRIAFEKTAANGASWVSDHQLRLAKPGGSYNTRTPDGVFEWDHRDSTYTGVLEFERCSYGKEVLFKVFRRLKIHYGTSLTFFVCRSQERQNTVMAWARASRYWEEGSNQIYFSHFELANAKGIYGAFRSPWGFGLNEGEEFGFETS